MPAVDMPEANWRLAQRNGSHERDWEARPDTVKLRIV
jgi:hypothetical protein